MNNPEYISRLMIQSGQNELARPMIEQCNIDVEGPGMMAVSQTRLSLIDQFVVCDQVQQLRGHEDSSGQRGQVGHAT